jgi:hypothetical protein
MEVIAMSASEWATAVGEFVIAGVILWEMEVNRREWFLAKAGQIGNYADRGKIYSAFYDTNGESIEDRSTEFCKRIWKEDKENAKLKSRCERQIVLFNRLGQISRRASFYKRDYVKLFPHAVVLFWIMIRPYILERRAMTGDWWASDFQQLTKQCLEFLFDENPNAHLSLYDRNRERKEDLIIPTSHLRKLQDELNHARPKRV